MIGSLWEPSARNRSNVQRPAWLQQALRTVARSWWGSDFKLPREQHMARAPQPPKRHYCWLLYLNDLRLCGTWTTWSGSIEGPITSPSVPRVSQLTEPLFLSSDWFWPMQVPGHLCAVLLQPWGNFITTLLHQLGELHPTCRGAETDRGRV